MKRAEIVIDEYEGRVTVLEFKNIQREDGLPKEYMHGSPRFYRSRGIVVLITNDGDRWLMSAGDAYKNDVFAYLVSQMKLAGGRLAAINKAVKTPRRVVIEI